MIFSRWRARLQRNAMRPRVLADHAARKDLVRLHTPLRSHLSLADDDPYLISQEIDGIRGAVRRLVLLPSAGRLGCRPDLAVEGHAGQAERLGPSHRPLRARPSGST